MDAAITNIPFVLGALLAIVVVVLVIVTTSNRQNRVAQSSLQRIPETKCVRCSKNMDEGFVAIGGMTWRSIHSSPKRFTTSGEKLKNIPDGQALSVFNFGVPENRALRCNSCSLIVIDHSSLFVLSKGG